VLAADLAAAKALIEKHEGRRAWVYRDSLGIPTIGVGFNLQRDDAQALVEASGADFSQVRAGETSLTEDQIDYILDECINECLTDLQKLFPNFDQMPREAQLVLLDLRFNLGPQTLRSFRLTLASFKAARYHKAAALLEPTRWARQVGKRAVEDIAMLRRIPE